MKSNKLSEFFNTKLLPIIMESEVGQSTKKELKDNYEVFSGNKKTTITVDNIDCVLSAHNYAKTGKTMLLNMASYKKPGGGVLSGTIAQEETICRRTNLYKSLSTIEYPLKFNQYVYTNDVKILFSDVYHEIPNECIDVITIAAINLNADLGNKNYEEYTYRKIYQIYYEAYINNVDNLILSAFGCGVFSNNPEYISNAFLEVYNKYFSGAFNNICFVILNDHNSVSSNFEIFNKIFNI